MATTLPWAEDVNYWHTGQSAPDQWLEKASASIRSAGGKVLSEAFGSEATTGRAAYMLAFELSGDRFRLIWPVLPSRTHNERAARIQAATLLYHDVKARCLTATVLGARVVFFAQLILPDGRTASELSVPELAQGLPALFAAPFAKPAMLPAGETMAVARRKE